MAVVKKDPPASARMEDKRLARVTAIAAKFPESVRETHGSHASFLVRKKVFAYFLNDHHGDGIVSIACKALPGDNHRLIAAHADRYYLPAYIGPRGWVALRLDRGKVDWEEAAELLLGSYLLVAPKTLAGKTRLRSG